MCARDICLQDDVDHLTNGATTCQFNLLALGKTLCTGQNPLQTELYGRRQEERLASGNHLHSACCVA